MRNAAFFLALLAAPAFAQAPPAAPHTTLFPGLVVPLESPFFRELLARPWPADRADIDMVAEALQRGGQPQAGARVTAWADRIELGKLTGQPVGNPPATFAAAIGDDAQAEDIVEIRKQAMRTMLAMEPIDAKAESKYRIKLRATATNRSTQDIVSFGAEIPNSTFHFECQAEAGGAIPVGKTVAITCLDRSDLDRDPVVLARLDERPIPLEITVMTLKDRWFTRNLSVGPHGYTHFHDAQRRGRELLEANSCEALMACEQGRARDEAFTRHYEEERARFAVIEAAKARKGEMARMVGIAGALATLVVMVAMGAKGRGAPAGPRGVFATLAAWWTLLTGAVVFAATLLMLLYGDALGYGGFLVIFAWLYATPALVAGAAVLGIAMLDRMKRTPFRMATLGFGLATLAYTAAGYLLVT